MNKGAVNEVWKVIFPMHIDFKIAKGSATATNLYAAVDNFLAETKGKLPYALTLKAVGNMGTIASTSLQVEAPPPPPTKPKLPAPSLQ